MNPLSKWKIGIYLAALFLAGVLTGGLVGMKFGARLMFRPPRPGVMAERFGADLKRKLDLTAAQTQKVTAIISNIMSDFGASLSNQISLAFSNTNVRVAQELTAEQRVKFEKLQKEAEARIGQRFEVPSHSEATESGR